MKSVLIVEPDPERATELVALVSEIGYRVAAVTSSAAAAVSAARRLAPAVYIVSLDRFEARASEELATRLVGAAMAPVVFTTATPTSERTLAARANLAFGFVAEPIDRRWLAAELATVLARQEAAEALAASERRIRALAQRASLLPEGGAADDDEPPPSSEQVERVVGPSHRLASFCSWRWDAASGTAEWSGALLEMLGLTVDEWRAGREEALARIVALEDFARLRHEFEQLERAPGRAAVTVRAQIGGGVRHFEVRATSRHSAQGELAAIFGSLQDVTEYERALAALRASEDRHRRLFTGAMEGMFLTAMDGTLLDVNPAFAKMLGFERPDELIGRNTLEFYVEPADRQRVREAFGATGEVKSLPVRWRRRDGELLYAEMNARYQLGEDGRPRAYQGFFVDVTDKRLRDLALVALSTGLARETGPSFFGALCRQLAALLEVEVALVCRAQLARRSLKSMAVAVDGRERPPLADELDGAQAERILRGETIVVERDARRAFGPEVDRVTHGIEALVITPLFDAQGKVNGSLGALSRRPLVNAERIAATLRLFALRAGAELDREAADERFAGVFEHAPDALLIADEGGRVLMANRMAETLTGHRRETLVGRSVDDLLPLGMRDGHATHRAAYMQVATDRKLASRTRPLAVRRADGSELPVEISLSPLQTEQGLLVVTVLRDTSPRMRAEAERAQLEEQLRQAQRLESLGTLAGGIAHDFNNVLAAIVANVGVARAELDDRDSVALCLDEITHATDRAASLIRQILAFSRQQPGKKAPLSLGPVVQEAAALLRATIPAGIEISVAISDESPLLLGDATQLHQVVMNLATNAWQAIERPTGHIAIAVHGVTFRDDAAAPAGLTAGRYAVLEVDDDGRGMDVDTRARIFEPFFTTKEVGKGTGLGLSVLHRIVGDHAGAVLVDSAPGAGSRFTVYFPEVGATVTAPSARPSTGPRRPVRVMLIDDEPSLARAGKRLLERRGYQVVAYTKPREAIAALGEEPRGFDVVITDQNMPDLSGFEVAKAIRDLREDLPVILVSGFRTLDESELAAVNVREHLDKPYSLEALEGAIGRVVDHR
jgi:two-component system cell cycle sensor histidine kinase/response regulator CckA